MTEQRAGRWEGAGEAELARAWDVPAVHLYARAGSTNDVARALAEAGAPAGTVVLADEQSAGRGRGGKGWASAPGLGVWMSLVLRPAALPAPGLLPILVGLAAAEALDPFVRPARVAIKWPNDLQLAGRKVGGILCEGSWDAARPGAVVAGIGINVLHAPDDFPPEVQPLATSLRIAAGWSPPRAEVAGALVRALVPAVTEPPAQLAGALLEAMRGRDALAGRPVHVTGARALAGTALGVTPSGALLVRGEDGVLHTVTSGTVRAAGPAHAHRPRRT
ncbi:MAG TPA: biotin--[acetyl-CoA-carboxylase] ligase [Longimicrobiaceae bacterium]|nr:biotin--[acetyl-CoA-carboxylase] ligase [Longimicrobiaceae bacterium]